VRIQPLIGGRFSPDLHFEAVWRDHPVARERSGYVPANPRPTSGVAVVGLFVGWIGHMPETQARTNTNGGGLRLTSILKPPEVLTELEVVEAEAELKALQSQAFEIVDPKIG
jgi:hypothetical protein